MNHPIVNAINYDKFGSRSRITYGNGTKAEYTYDIQSRRLSTLNSKNINNEAMQTIGYTYDNVGNITQISNSATAMANGLGGSYTCNYTYDNLYRLTSSTGNWGRTYNYSTGMSYSSSGRILSKTVNALTSINGTSGTITRNYSYTYNGTNKPHAARGAGTGTQMNYDGNGNMTSYSNPTVIGSTTRQQAWDEENRLGASGDGSYLTSYVYDAGGDRVLKLSGARQQMLVNNQYYINFANLNESKTLYVGGYMTVTDGGYTKHYYAESERVHSRLGGGFQYAPVAMGQALTQIYGESYAELALAMRHHLRMDVQAVGYDSTQTTFPNAFRSLDRLTGNNAETEKFFYHPDHLGSSSMITDKNGLACQHLQYLPFGEQFVEQRTTATYYTPYKFSAKEKDTETGYSYFGARYYDSDLSVWLSVDPMADQRSWISPYNYCQWNPVMRTDPTGMLDGPPDYYLNLITGRVEYHKGSENRISEGLVHLAGDKASMGDIENALNTKNYKYRQDNSVSGGFRVDVEKQYKGWKLLQGSKKLAVACASMTGISVIEVATSLYVLSTSYRQGISTKKSDNQQSTTNSNIIDKFVEENPNLTIQRNEPKGNQEFNITIKDNETGYTMNIRVETDVVSTKYGGDGISQQRHMNIEVFTSNKNRVNLPNRGHIILPK